MNRPVAMLAVAVTLGGLLAGCTSSTTGAGPRRAPPVQPTTVARSDTTTTPRSARVDDALCARTPPTGAFGQVSAGLSYPSGRILIRVNRLAPTPPPGGVPDTDPDPTVADGCRVFTRWGNDDPVVAPDSALFTFADGRGDGAQIEAPLAELVSRRDLTAGVGVVAEGRYFQAITCALHMTTFTDAGAAGTFTCPNAVLVEGNPFTPDDDIDATDRSADPNPPDPAVATPPTGAANAPDPSTAPSAALSGWFEVRR